MRKGKTISDAAHEWVASFGHFPLDMIHALFAVDPDSWTEVTRPRVGDKVYVYTTQRNGEILKIIGNETDSLSLIRYIVEDDEGKELFLNRDDFEYEKEDTLPCWGTMWNFGDSADDYWLDSLGGIQIMSDLGIRVFEHDEWGYFFGIDGGGFSFYEAFWIPLYKARGLQWHDPEADKPEPVIKVTCYGMTEEFNDRDHAKSKYLEAVRNSEGAERDRYLSIYLQLEDGNIVCSDENA